MSEQQIQDYKDSHPLCETGCDQVPWGKPHHIKSRGSGGSDEPENLLRLCWEHHVMIETVGDKRFTEYFPLLYTKIAKMKYGIERLSK